METRHKQHRLKGRIEFRRAAENDFVVVASSVALASVGDAITECRLRFAVTAEQYVEIGVGELFNVSDDVLPPGFVFDPAGHDTIVVETLLRPDLVPGLSVKGLRTGPSFVTLIRGLPATSAIPAVDSWFCLSATTVDGGTMFKTLWDYIDLRDLTDDGRSEEAFRTALVSFADEQMFGGPDDRHAAREKAVFAALVDAAFTSDDGEPEVDGSVDTDEWVDAIDGDVADALIDLMTDVAGAAEPPAVVSRSLSDRVANLLRQGGWEFRRIDEHDVFSMGVQGQNGSWTAYLQVIEKMDQLVMYSIVRVDSPVAARPHVAEFITRANHDLAIGNFEMDFETGEVRFKTSIDLAGGTLDAAVLDRLVDLNMASTDQYLSGLDTVVDGSRSPSLAIDVIEDGTGPRRSF